MRDLNQVFKRLSVENERSALAVLAGMHNSIVRFPDQTFSRCAWYNRLRDQRVQTQPLLFPEIQLASEP
jgi:hypothetical protein